MATRGCRAASPESAAPSWLAADEAERLAQLERQLRGFHLAVVETKYRYTELFWAARDGNWEAAEYHVRKLRLAIENGLERRPKRAVSAKPFLDGPLAAMEDAVAARDPARFEARFRELTAARNACHAMEQVPFLEVHPPERGAEAEPRGSGLPRRGAMISCGASGMESPG